MAKTTEPKEYFQTDAEVARYLGLHYPQFLEMVAKGKFGVQRRPLDPTPVYYKSDVDLWLSCGRPGMQRSHDIGEVSPWLPTGTTAQGVNHGVN